jgi:hypothetical protein
MQIIVNEFQKVDTKIVALDNSLFIIYYFKCSNTRNIVIAIQKSITFNCKG